MHIAHIMASCMGGIRTAGDLVAWMQMTRKMKIHEAKAYVAENWESSHGSDQRGGHARFGKSWASAWSPPWPAAPRASGPRCKIAELLDIHIPSVDLFKAQMGFE